MSVLDGFVAYEFLPGRWAVAGRGPRAAGPRACF